MHGSRSSVRFGFHVHAFAFALTMIVLIAINLVTGPPYWVLWVALGWGIGVFTHWWFALGPGAAAARIKGGTLP